MNRTLGLVKKNCDATIPVDSSSIPDDNAMKKVAADSVSLLFLDGFWSLMRIEGYLLREPLDTGISLFVFDMKPLIR